MQNSFVRKGVVKCSFYVIELSVVCLEQFPVVPYFYQDFSLRLLLTIFKYNAKHSFIHFCNIDHGILQEKTP